jgi:glutamate-5-semialdehyde dehydrogenase
MALQQQMVSLAKQAHAASFELSRLTTETKNRVLQAWSEKLKKAESEILKANQKDVRLAEKKGISPAMVDRLTLNHSRLNQMAQSVEAVARLEDPIGKILHENIRPNGLKIQKVSAPLGVVLIIYEARPNVTTECASLCLKSGNCVILRGGSETFFTNRAIVSVLQKVLKQFHIAQAAVTQVGTTDRKAVDLLLKLNQWISLVIPRGGNQLIQKVTRTSLIPVIKHDAGVCHVYVDKDADLAMAVEIVFNAKCQRPSVCNAMETLLVHESVAASFLPRVKKKLDEKKCVLVGCSKTRKILKNISVATEKDWRAEYLDYKLSVRVVKDVKEAIDHIHAYGSSHTESIVTENEKTAQLFLNSVDSSSVMWNASTRFSDGFEYGFGAEIGISTQKLHARGPMGLEGLTSYKYLVFGRGQIRT